MYIVCSREQVMYIVCSPSKTSYRNQNLSSLPQHTDVHGGHVVVMESEGNETEVASIYVLGDAGAGREVGLPQNEIRKLRMNGQLAGAFAITGHRSILYHRHRLRQKINDAFKTAPRTTKRPA